MGNPNPTRVLAADPRSPSVVWEYGRPRTKANHARIVPARSDAPSTPLDVTAAVLPQLLVLDESKNGPWLPAYRGPSPSRAVSARLPRRQTAQSRRGRAHDWLRRSHRPTRTESPPMLRAPTRTGQSSAASPKLRLPSDE